jgi:hypothetical protein
MATAVDICNLALSQLGDPATLSSLEPPEGSPQADHCARFYPIALKEMLFEHAWSFATRRSVLARLPTEIEGDEQAHAFPLPADCLRVIDVEAQSLAPRQKLRRFSIESMDSQTCIIMQSEQCVIKYVSGNLNPAAFSPLFVKALVHRLAAYLAGPVIPGSSGASLAQTELKLAEAFLAKAKAADARQQADRDDIHSPFNGDCSLGDAHAYY